MVPPVRACLAPPDAAFCGWDWILRGSVGFHRDKQTTTVNAHACQQQPSLVIFVCRVASLPARMVMAEKLRWWQKTTKEEGFKFISIFSLLYSLWFSTQFLYFYINVTSTCTRSGHECSSQGIRWQCCKCILCKLFLTLCSHAWLHLSERVLFMWRVWSKSLNCECICCSKNR